MIDVFIVLLAVYFIGLWIAWLILAIAWDHRSDYELGWGIAFWPITFLASIVHGFRHMWKKVWYW